VCNDCQLVKSAILYVNSLFVFIKLLVGGRGGQLKFIANLVVKGSAQVKSKYAAGVCVSVCVCVGGGG
jgi:hypothetical protein